MSRKVLILCITSLICCGKLIITKAHDSSEELYKKCKNGLGECVPYFLCMNGTINTDGRKLIDSRSKRFVDDADEECEDYFEKCCEIDSIAPIKNQNPKTQPGEFSIPESCGFRNPEGVGFEKNKESDGTAEYGEFPWMAIVLRKIPNNETNKTYKCGGSLIAKNVVLTAAACIENLPADDIIVRLGEWDVETKNELFLHVEYTVVDIVIHKEFDADNNQNDIGLLFLSENVEFAEHINTICLPPQNQNFDGKNCIVSGWGKDFYGKRGKYQPILKKIELPIVAFDQCQKVLRKTRLDFRFILHEGYICAGGEENKDACSGDGGSPLVCPIDGMPGRYFQAGIVSWGIDCGKRGTPGVYTNIAYYRSWIDGEITIRNID